MKFRKQYLLSTVMAAMLPMASFLPLQPARADDAAAADKIETVEVTGSSIKRAVSDEAMPVTTIPADTFTDLGFTTVANVIDSLTIGASNIAGGAREGTNINLRGLGLDRTLVLMNGRRLANEATQDAFVNVDVIPFSALERVEILRDGASSTYGTDAIGGVINFITKQTYVGAQATVQALRPQEGGGGNENRVNALIGYGDLNTDGWNFFVTGDEHQRTYLPMSARSQYSNNNLLNSLGIGSKAGAGTYADPANVSAVINKKTVQGNPYYATDCTAPYSLQALSNTCINNNTALYSVGVSPSQQASLFSRASYKVADDNLLSVEVMYAKEFGLAYKSPTTSAGFTPLGGSAPVMTISSSSPFYPGGSAGVPAVPGITGNPVLNVTWQLDGQGGAVIRDQQINKRIVVNDEGHWGGWDYKLGLLYAGNKQSQDYVSGYYNGPALDAGVANGILNPFGAQNSAGQTYLDSISIVGPARYSSIDYSGVDFLANHDLWQLDGGALAMALGAEFHHDSMSDIAPPIDALVPYNGRLPSVASGNRNVSAVFTEFDAPVTKELDFDLAARMDDYSDFGAKVSPKASFRYQPIQMVILRGSADTGFRAPSLIDRYGYAIPQATKTTSSKWDDPLLCPGTIGLAGTGTALPGYNSTIVCNAKQPLQTGSNPSVGPEHSNDASLGVVVEPIKALQVSVDWWRIFVSNTIGTLGEQFIFDNPTKYASLFVRNPDGTLAYVKDTISNLGDTLTYGEDVNLAYTLPTTPIGDFALHVTGTYVNEYKFQNEKGGVWVQSVGRTSGLNSAPVTSTPTFIYRWKHFASIVWTEGDFATTFSQAYNSQMGDLNQFAAGSPFIRNIKPYGVMNLSTTYVGIKDLTLQAGMNNITNAKPPLTNDSAAGPGYVSNIASPLGRAFLVTATYKFL
jgi:iron complex outermembrane receptor protein